MQQRPYIGISRGNFGAFIGLIIAGWAMGWSMPITLLTCGTLGFAAMIFEPPLHRRRNREIHFVIVPPYQAVQHLPKSPPAPKTEKVTASPTTDAR
jgi:predicted lipid-binding transport protein (Tim44 family)